MKLARFDLLPAAVLVIPLVATALLSSECRFDPVARVVGEAGADGQAAQSDANRWEDAGPHSPCKGHCSPCPKMGKSNCAVVQGCTWKSGPACTGICSDCSLLTRESACRGQQGCTWHAEGRCQGQCRDCAGLNHDTCVEVGGCRWKDQGKSCSGTPDSCNSIQGATLCIGAPGCQWNPRDGVCTGRPNPCEGRLHIECYAGCQWLRTQGCDGTCSPCESYQDQNACGGQPNCTWTQVQPRCDGTCSPCETFPDDTSCGNQAGCRWSTSGSCQGSCRPCESFPDQASCQNQPLCSWTDE